MTFTGGRDDACGESPRRPCSLHLLLGREIPPSHSQRPPGAEGTPLRCWRDPKAPAQVRVLVAAPAQAGPALAPVKARGSSTVASRPGVGRGTGSGQAPARPRRRLRLGSSDAISALVRHRRGTTAWEESR
jgi:hypothetical protein